MNIALKLRHMRTQNERRVASGLLAESRELEAELPVISPRRRPNQLRTVYHDVVVYAERNWKKHRHSRWKAA